MSNKFTGITSAGSAIPVYDKDAHEALSSKLDTTAFSSVSGEFATVDDVVAAVSGKADTSAIPSLDGYATQEWVGEQGYLAEVPESAVSGFATHEEVESATSGKADTSALSGYLTKASGDDLYVKNTPYQITGGPTDGSGGNPIFKVNPGGLYVGNSSYKVLSATWNSFKVGNPDNGLILSADSNKFIYSGASNTTISADNGSFAFNGQYHSFNVKRDGINFSGVSANLDVTSGIIFSSNNPNLGSAALTTAQYNTIVQMPSPKFEARNISGAGFSIEGSGAKGYDHNGNVVWDTSNPPAPNNLVGYGDTKASTGGLNGNIILTYFGKAATGNPLTSAPYTILDCNGLSATYGSTANAPYTVVSPNGITARYSGNSAAAEIDFNDIAFTRGSSAWSLTNSVQKREIECDSATSAITAIAGSAIGGGGEVPEGVMVESAVGYNAVNEISGYNGSAIAQYGAEKQWLVHDDTLVHAANSAQYALGVNLSAVAQLLGVDETVLYSNLTGRPTTVGSYIDLSESPLNFTEIAIYLNGSSPTGSNNISNGYEKVPVEQLSSSNGLEFLKEFVGTVAGNLNSVHDMGCGYSGTSGTRWTKWYGYSYNVQNKNVDFNNNAHLNIWKVVGIGRKQ